MKDILLIGDGCLDKFVYCEASRLCPDIPVPVLQPKYESQNGGMACNVFENISSLGVNCDLITNPRWQHVEKIRYVHYKTNHTFFRVDRGHDYKRIDLSQLNLSDYKIVVISDYNKGFLLEEDIEYICSRHDTVFIDTKKTLNNWVKNAKFIKINRVEYEHSNSFIEQNGLENKIIKTIGGGGCLFQNKQYPVKELVVNDASGAGDSFLAGLVVEYLRTSDIIRSIIFANQCAEKVVVKRGVSRINE